MKYMGSKDRYAKYLLHWILFDRKPGQWYVELFAGGMNIIDKVSGNRIANDINPYLIALFKALATGWEPPIEISREEYLIIRDNKENYEPHFIGYVGFCCAYSGVFFGGYSGKTKTKVGERDYQAEARKNILRQKQRLETVIFHNLNYSDVILPDKSIIYCDPPYQNTSEYHNKNFDSGKFFDFLRQKKKEGHTIFLTEYDAPQDFKLLVKLNASSSLSANGKSGGRKKSTEKLFTL
jgi:DNA adenine methylase